MFNMYVTIAWRNLLKKRFYSAVHIAGLSAGVAFALLILSFAWSEQQVNKQLKNVSRQYIIQSRWKDPGQGLELTSIGLLAKTLKEAYPDLVANYFRWDGITSVISKGDRSFRQGIQICDSTLLRMYGFRLLHGTEKGVFDGPFSMLLTREMALKYFGRADVVGQTLSVESFSGTKHDFLITGVMEKPAKNSVTFITEENDNQFYVSTASMRFFGRDMDTWNNPYVVSYVQLNEHVQAKDLEQPMARILKLHAPPEVANNLHPFLVSLQQYHLSANNGLIRKLLLILSAVALFILLMAVINFINMTISLSGRRLREIGVRKVMGGLKHQLVVQFLTESLLLVLIAVVFSVVLYALFKDLFGSLLHTALPQVKDFPPQYILYLLAFTVVLGVGAGTYPAFLLSSYPSAESLKGRLTSVHEKLLLRKLLIAFQFGTATIVFAGAIVISQQVHLFFGTDLGYAKDNILSLQVPRNWTPDGVRQMEDVRNKLAQNPQVAAVSLSYEVPDGNNSGVFSLYRPDEGPRKAVQSESIITDEYYARTYAIPLAAGVFYGPEGALTDSSKLVINEKMAYALGWKSPADALGQKVMNAGGDRVFRVAGVTRNFHFGTMQQPIRPLTFYQVRAFPSYRVFSIRLKPGDVAPSIRALQEKWAALLPGTPFEFTFMNDTLKQLYKTEIQLQRASYAATALAFIIVLLGVLGLISLSVQKRTREIGIRKILGATVKGIIVLFMEEILGTILLAGLLACPLAYFLMKTWLSDYAFRVGLTPFPFLAAVAGLTFFAAIVVVSQTLKAALANPAQSLRTE